MSVIASNIRVLRTLKKISQETLADELNISRSRLGAYEESRNEPPIELLIKFADYFNVSIDILVRFDLRRTDVNTITELGNNRLLFPMIIDKDNKDRIEVITAKASAGYLNGYSDPEFIENMPFMELPFEVIGKHRSFPVKGDSMPPLTTGDFVIGKYIESMGEVSDGKTYILLTKEEGIVYKRVYKKQDYFELHSDNKMYLPYKINASDILEIWEFVCCLKTSDKKEEEINLKSMMQLLLSMQVEIQQLKKK